MKSDNLRLSDFCTSVYSAELAHWCPRKETCEKQQPRGSKKKTALSTIHLWCKVDFILCRSQHPQTEMKSLGIKGIGTCPFTFQCFVDLGLFILFAVAETSWSFAFDFNGSKVPDFLPVNRTGNNRNQPPQSGKRNISCCL